MNPHPFCIAVCDDEPTDRKQIRIMTKMVCEQENIYAEISYAHCVYLRQP